MTKKIIKITLILFIIIAGITTLVSCNKKIEFEDLNISCEDATNVAVGTYTLRYKVENLEKYLEKNVANINVVVVDKDNIPIEVVDNRVVQIEANNNYLATIIISSENGDQTKRFSYHITSERANVTITFHSEYGNFQDITRQILYGSYLADIPEVPEYIPIPNAGCTATVTEAQWDRKDFSLIKENITVNAIYKVKNIPNIYTISFNTNGGNPIEDIQQYYNTTLYEPENPTKNGFVFFGWYEDENDFSQRYQFSLIEARNLTLYARWIEKNSSSDESLFIFEENDFGYTISAKNKENLTGDIVLPNIYNNKPVTRIKDYGFTQCTLMENLTLPKTIEEIGVYAFSGQTLYGIEEDMNLQTITFMQTDLLIYIPEYCFASCKNLVSINIPASINHIDKYAFYNCNKLSCITFDDNSNLEYIYINGFENCSSLVEINFPETLIKIDSEAFLNCRALRRVTLNSTIPPLQGNQVFYYKEDENFFPIDFLAFYVKSESKELYENSSFGNFKIEIIN